MRCIGTLEFVSDFHNKCHQTQRQLLLDKERSPKLAKEEIKTDFESDKENTSPRSNIEIKEKLTPAKMERKSSRMENKLEQLKKIMCKEGVFGKNTIPGSDKVENLDGNKEDECSSEIKHNPIESKGHVVQERRTALLQGQNPLAMEIHEESGGKVLVSRLGRKQNGRKGSGYTTTNGKARKSQKKISLSKSQKKSPIGMNAPAPDVIAIPNNFFHTTKKEEKITFQDLGRRFLSIAKEEINESQKVPPRTVKIESLNSGEGLVGAVALVKSDESAQEPSDIVILTSDRSGRGAGPESTAKSPRPGDEAGEMQDRECDAIEEQVADETSKIISIENDGTGTALTMRKSVIESVKNSKTFEIDTAHSLVKQNEIGAPLTLSKDSVPGNLLRSATLSPEPSSIVSEELAENKGGNVGNFRERRKKSEGQFGKLSELITNEQKEIIETLYTVNMGVVDNEEVYRNIKILDKIKVKCEICGKTYPRMDKCQVHIWGHLNMKPYFCKSCDFVTLTVSNIRCHIRKRHLKIKPFQCNLCEKTYGTAVLLEEHINSHTGAKPYKCKLCDFATSNRQVLSYHKTTHKPAKDISCDVCGKKFFSNCRMRAHMIVHNKDKSLMCKLCSTYLCNAEALEKHYQKVHSRDYVCNICGIRTRSRKALTNHENVHSEAKYRCPLCSNAYKSKHMLKEHLLKHQGIRKYKCELCQKSFAQQSHIAAHMSVHMGKRYPCPGCNKLFNRRDNMRIHTRRCKAFKSNPDTKNLWGSQNSTRHIEADGQSIAESDTPMESNAVTEPTENSKTDTETLETGLGLIRINLLTGKTDYSNSNNSRHVMPDEDFDKFKNEEGEILRIGEVEIFPLQSNSRVVGIQNEGKTVITENVLRPECF